jgi:23S rRNA pseudouridine1911/1915/1917 synthase
MEISIVYDSPDFVVINKPSGLLTHPRNKDDHRPSVLSWLLEHYPQAATVGDPTSLKLRGAGDPPRPGIVHRIDKETSGLLLLVKTQDTFKYFKHLFHDRLISKQYIALVYGTVDNDKGIIDAPLFKFGTRQSTRPPKEGKTLEQNAHTEYRVMKRYESYTLLEVSPKTGRTHQIRIHFRSIGHPIVGDKIYAPKSLLALPKPLAKEGPPELGRLFLHAQKLSFTTPSGQAMTLEADMPPELEHFLQTLQPLQE